MRRQRSISISEEAAAFRAEANSLRVELAAVRVVIADTMIELSAFSEVLRDIQGTG